jgi:hypothetical protein
MLVSHINWVWSGFSFLMILLLGLTIYQQTAVIYLISPPWGAQTEVRIPVHTSKSYSSLITCNGRIITAVASNYPIKSWSSQEISSVFYQLCSMCDVMLWLGHFRDKLGKPRQFLRIGLLQQLILWFIN